MSANVSKIYRITKRGGKAKLLEVCGDANWRKDHPDSDQLRPIEILKNGQGDVEFRFRAPTYQPHEYVVTLTQHELRRALDLTAPKGGAQ